MDVKLLVNTMKSNEAQIGAWVNVIGYVQSQPDKNFLEKNDLSVPIQAIVLWCSGPLNIDNYGKSLDHMDLDRAKEKGESCNAGYNLPTESYTQSVS